ncbi:MAG: hypothetical protein KatS3mg079_411 [Caloramator sp.]|nr:MAG: hypothetical protein KatS3mg079_411 [Caloramator sp.]
MFLTSMHPLYLALLTIAIPSLEQLSKEGEEGRKKIAEYTRYAALIFAAIQGLSISLYLRNNGALAQEGWTQILINNNNINNWNNIL